jgi:hypothetical protein
MINTWSFSIFLSTFVFKICHVNFFLWYWGLNSGPSPWITTPVLFLWRVFQDRVLRNCFPGLALNHNPPDLCFLSSQYYRCESLVPDNFFFFYKISVGARGGTQVVQPLPSKCKALSSSPSTTKKKKSSFRPGMVVYFCNPSTWEA